MTHAQFSAGPTRTQVFFARPIERRICAVSQWESSKLSHSCLHRHSEKTPPLVFNRVNVLIVYLDMEQPAWAISAMFWRSERVLFLAGAARGAVIHVTNCSLNTLSLFSFTTLSAPLYLSVIVVPLRTHTALHYSLCLSSCFTTSSLLPLFIP